MSLAVTGAERCRLERDVLGGRGGGRYGGGGGGAGSTSGSGGGGGSNLVPARGSESIDTTGAAPSIPIQYTQPAPVVRTRSASDVTHTSATLHGTVNPRGADTTYHFQYGTSTAYGKHTSAQSAGSGSTAEAVSASISGLTPGTTYHYRIVAHNAMRDIRPAASRPHALGLGRSATLRMSVASTVLTDGETTATGQLQNRVGGRGSSGSRL